MKTLLRSSALATMVTLALSAGISAPAHAQPAPGYESGAAGQAPWVYADQRAAFGVVTRVDSVRAPATASNPGAGALLGGAIGAVIGRQVGGGSNGRAAGTLVGAVVGAIAGHHIEKSQRGDEVQRVSVQLDNGRIVTFDEASGTDLRVGERVRIDNNRVVRVADARDRYDRRRGDRRYEGGRYDDRYNDQRERSADLQSPLV